LTARADLSPLAIEKQARLFGGGRGALKKKNHWKGDYLARDHPAIEGGGVNDKDVRWKIEAFRKGGKLTKDFWDAAGRKAARRGVQFG